MENGVKPVENRVSDEEEEKRVLVGSEESKKVDDEVFEEAVGIHDSLHDQGIKTESRNENSVLGGEIDSFEEAIGVSSELADAVVSEDKVKDVVVGDKVDRVSDLHTGEGVKIVKTEVSGEIGKVNGSDIEDERLENGDSSTESLEETINSLHDKEIKNESRNENSVVGGEIDSFEEAISVSTESADAVVSADKVEGVAVGDNIDRVSDLHTGDEVEIVKKEISGEIGKVNESDIEVERLENGDCSIENMEETVEDRKLDNGNAGIIVGDKEVRPREEIGLEEEKSDEIKESKSVGDYQHDKSIESTVASSGATVGLLDEKSKGRDDNDIGGASTELKDVDGEVNEISGKFETENKNERNNEVNDAAYGEDILSPKEISEGNGTSTNICDDSVEGMVASEMGSPPLEEKSTNDSNEKIQTGTGYFNSKSPPQQLNEMVSDVLNTNNDNEKNNRVLDEDLEKAKEDPKTEPKPEFASSAPKSTNPNPLARPAGLGRAAPLLEPAPRAAQQSRVNGTVPHNTQTQQIEDSSNGEAEELDETREKLQMIRVKFLRLAHRLGQTPHNVVVAQVLYRLGLAEQLRGRNGGRVGAFSFDRASAMAEQLEAAGQEPLDFSCTIMVLGKSGVGKSATINSIFDEVKFNTDAFQMGTKKVQDVVGTVQGIKVRVIDTPGLLPSWSDQRHNEQILHSVKRFIKKTPPDIVLYLDRLDMQSRDFGDMPLLRTITEIFGPSIWFNAIVVLTHAASAPPDGPNGTASSYDMFVTQRSHVVQQAIRQAAGDMRLMNPVSLVENHSACRTNRAGQRVLPNGQVWKPHLLLLSFASKILAEANALLKLQDSPPGKPFTARSRAPPLPFLLSSLLQSRQQVKLPEEQFGDDDDDGLDDDLDDSSDSEEESELDELPPFKRLTKAQVVKLTKAQKKAYFDELEYREKLFMKKQLKEEKRRRKIMKKMAAAVKDMPSEYTENTEEESGGAASVPVPMPDLALPASFDSDNPTHRYRFLDSSNQWLVRPVLETHGWDHDVGYEGINVERLFAVKDKIPLSFSGQISKDKKDANVQMELNSSIKHGEGKATSVGFDMQTVGKELAYTLRSETRFSNFRRNKATAGVSVTHLGDTYSAGVKVEDKLIVNKRFRVVMTGGAMSSRGDVAYGGSLEAQLRDKDFPLGRSLLTLGLSVMDWHGDLAIGCNIQSQVPVGRTTNLVARANLNNRGAGQVSIRLNSAEQLQLALIGLVPLLKKLLGYSQQIQFGQ